MTIFKTLEKIGTEIQNGTDINYRSLALIIHSHIATMDNESYDFIFKIVLLGDSGVGKCCYYLEMAMNIVNIFVQDSESILFQ